MASVKAKQLSEVVRMKVEEMKRLCKGLDENTASRAPSGRWSPKEILSHLCGPEGIGPVPPVQKILQNDNPRLDLNPGNPFFTEKRSRMSLAELLKEFETEYGRMADLVATLSDEQLARKVHVPAFKEAPMGEHLTLEVWVRTLADRHIAGHIEHMREIMQQLGVKVPR